MKAALFALMAASGLADRSWTKDTDEVDTILLGIDFPTPSVGFIAGGGNGVGPFIKKSTDSGATWTSTKLVDTSDLMFLDIAMGSATSGVGSGIGLGKTGNAYTTDGQSFQHSSGVALVTVSQSVETIKGVQGGFGLTGQFGTAQVAVSSNGGKHFSYVKVGDPSIPARYGSFPSQDTWYIASGMWPNTTSSVADEDFYGHHLSKFVRLHFDGQGRPSHHEILPRASRAEAEANDAGWIAVIYKTTDGGRTFNEVYRDTGRFYPNQISCWDENTCQVVVEGDGSWDAAGVLLTTDGGATWDMVAQYPGISLMSSEMLSATEGWVAGALLKSQFDIEGQFYHTTDGWQSNAMDGVKGVYPADMSFASDGSAWAVAMTPQQTSCLVKYA